MRQFVLSALAAAALAAGAQAGGGPAVGDRANWPEVKETIGIASFSAKEAEGKIVFVEVFRTW